MPPARFRILRRSLLPAAASFALHGILLLLVLGVTVGHLSPIDRGPTLLELDSVPIRAAKPGESLSRAESSPSPSASAWRPDEALAEAVRSAASEAMARSDSFDTPPEFSLQPEAPASLPARPPEQPAAAFAGLQSRAATRIVYVVDTSGSMVHTLSFVLDELSRSISRLKPTQSFQVVLFSDRPGEAGFRTPPVEPGRDGLIVATPANRVAVCDWLRTEVIAGGRSNPIDGLGAALELRPDLIFLLARGIQRTGVDIVRADNVDAVLDRLDELNPVETSSGLRRTTIKTIQFVDEDPTGLMQRIALIHGDGSGSYRLLRPEALGKDPPPPPPSPLPEPIERAISKAAGLLVNLDRNLAPLAVLSGVGTRSELDAVGDSARLALEVLSDAPPATPRLADGRAQLLRARSALLAASVEPDAARRLDFALRAIADAAPLPIIDPDTDAQRTITLSLARSFSGQAEAGYADLLSLIRNRADAELDVTTIARARLALVTVSDSINPRSPRAQRARDALMQTLDAERGDSGQWPDASWRAIAAASLSRSLALAGAPADAALAPLLDQLEDRSWPIEHRRALLYPRLAVVARDLPDPPVPALRAMAEYASWTGRVDEAVDLFLRLADRTDDAGLRADSLRNAAVLLDRRGDAGDQARARALLLRFAVEQPDHPDTDNALALAFARPGGTTEQLETALDISPQHTLADRWRLRLAARYRGKAGLEVLGMIAQPSRESAALELELIDELLDGEDSGDRTLLVRAAELADLLGTGMSDRRRIELAGSLLESDPAKAIEALSGVGRGSPVEDLADLLRIRARLALGWDAEAFETARSLAARREPIGDEVFWEAATVWLELGSARGGPDARSAARGHVARLRRLDPDLGGEPWAGRLDAIAK